MLLREVEPFKSLEKKIQLTCTVQNVLPLINSHGHLQLAGDKYSVNPAGSSTPATLLRIRGSEKHGWIFPLSFMSFGWKYLLGRK